MVKQQLKTLNHEVTSTAGAPACVWSGKLKQRRNKCRTLHTSPPQNFLHALPLTVSVLGLFDWPSCGAGLFAPNWSLPRPMDALLPPMASCCSQLLLGILRLPLQSEATFCLKAHIFLERSSCPLVTGSSPAPSLGLEAVIDVATSPPRRRSQFLPVLVALPVEILYL